MNHNINLPCLGKTTQWFCVNWRGSHREGDFLKEFKGVRTWNCLIFLIAIFFLKESWWICSLTGAQGLFSWLNVPAPSPHLQYIPLSTEHCMFSWQYHASPTWRQFNRFSGFFQYCKHSRSIDFISWQNGMKIAGTVDLWEAINPLDSFKSFSVVFF